jgi:hypothetical protein
MSPPQTVAVRSKLSEQSGGSTSNCTYAKAGTAPDRQEFVQLPGDEADNGQLHSRSADFIEPSEMPVDTPIFVGHFA